MRKTRVAPVALVVVMLGCGSEREPTGISEAPALANETLAYRPIFLGDLGGGRAYALAVNSSLQIVGGSTLPNGDTHGFLWENETMKDLGTLGGNYSEALGINAEGHVVGVSKTAAGANHAFLWKDGVMTDLGTVGNRESAALDINHDGVIGGGANGIPLLWKKGVLTRLPRPRNATHCAVAEVGSGTTAVGQCTVGQTARAILWNGTTVRDLGTLGGALASPAGINKWGVVVGSSWIRFNNGIHPFLWEDGKMIDLSTRGAPVGFSPVAISDRRGVAGNFGTGGGIHAGVWQKGRFTDISVPGTDSYAADIQISGHVVGNTVSGNTYRAVLWLLELVPPPAS